MDQAQAENLLGKMCGRRVAVLGDLMLDEYLFGEVSRISPEAPVPIVRINRERAVLGGAANVAANLKSIGAEPVLLGTLQKDIAGNRLQALLRGLEIKADWLVLDPSRPTIIKTRVIGQQQQMIRIDREEEGGCQPVAVAALCAPGAGPGAGFGPDHLGLRQGRGEPGADGPGARAVPGPGHPVDRRSQAGPRRALPGRSADDPQHQGIGGAHRHAGQGRR